MTLPNVLPRPIALVLSLGLCALAGCSSVPETPTASANAEIEDIESFDDIAAAVDAAADGLDPSDILVVLDIDNTILTSATDLGGDIWYQWQRGRLDVKPSASDEVRCLFEDAIGLLYELAPMRPTDPSLADTIAGWQNRGYTVFALTSRSPKYRAATERELARAGVDLSRTALAPRGNPNPVYRETADREWSYYGGIMMTTGMNKGEMLLRLLNRTNRSFRHIVFADDTRRHHVDMMRALGHQLPRTELTLLHYTRIEAERIREHGTVLTNEQADAMAADWRALQTTLLEVFPDRAQGNDRCLGTN